MKELLYHVIYREFKKKITGGSLPAGDKLPGVREIADEQQTSVNTVMSALKALEADGLIKRTQGQGIFVLPEAEWKFPAHAVKELGLIVYDMKVPFNVSLMSAVESAAAEREFKLVMRCSNGNPETENNIASDLVSAGVSALIITPASAADLSSGKFIRDVPVPLLYSGDFSPPPDFTGSYAVIDAYSGFYYAASFLLESGCECIAYIGGSPSEIENEPGWSACRDVLMGTAAGWSAEDGKAAMEGLLLNEEYPDGVICGSDTLAAGAVKACWEAGLEVPGDVSVVGCGDQEIAELLDPPLTSLRMPAEILGFSAVAFIQDMLGGRITSGERVRMRLDPELVIRKSSAEKTGSGSGFWL